MELLKACTSLEELSLWNTRHVPDELYTVLGQMRELKVLKIVQEQVPPALCSCISQLKHLEVVALCFIQCSSKTYVSFLNDLRACPMRELSLGATCMSEVFAEALKEGERDIGPLWWRKNSTIVTLLTSFDLKISSIVTLFPL